MHQLFKVLFGVFKEPIFDGIQTVLISRTPLEGTEEQNLQNQTPMQTSNFQFSMQLIATAEKQLTNLFECTTLINTRFGFDP